jgi:hypothetical protein
LCLLSRRSIIDDIADNVFVGIFDQKLLLGNFDRQLLLFGLFYNPLPPSLDPHKTFVVHRGPKVVESLFR